MPPGEWTVGPSWTAPPPIAGTLADLIQDLCREADPVEESTQLNSVAAPPDLPTADYDLSTSTPAVSESAETHFGVAAEPRSAATSSATPVLPTVTVPLQPPITVTVSSVAATEPVLAEPVIAESVLEEPLVSEPVLDKSTSAPSGVSELEDEMAQLDRLLATPATNASAESATWFLGLDLGTTGISAVLLNQASAQLYPLYWQSIEAGTGKTIKKFRLPTQLTLAPSEAAAAPLPTIRLQSGSTEPPIHLSHWKPYLQVAIPHYSPQTSQWEPVLQWSEQETVPLRTLQEGLQLLLTSLNSDRAAFMPTLVSGALAIETDAFQAILADLAGVIVGSPSNWPDTYSLNLSEAILQAGLVKHPSQIVFVEEAIAVLLSALPATDGRSVTLPHQPSSSQPQGHLHNAHWQGKTLILTAGASLTELVLVDLSRPLAKLNRTDFYVRSLPYAGQGIDQDIISQLLYPALLQPSDSPAATAYDLALEPFDLEEFQLDWPAIAELDRVKRYQLQQQLISSTAGQQLLQAARSLKLMLQTQPRFVLNYGSRSLTFERQDLTSQVLLPYVQRLNRELNTLLAQTNTTPAAVKQVICTGGSASLSSIARWLRQKLPNATLIQDTYTVSAAEDCMTSCSRAAYGLATVPLHTQVIDQSRHQYSDYFLLSELLRSVPQHPLSVETIMQLLEQRGIDTQECRFRILALLEGQLPPGLIPAESDRVLLTTKSAANPDYQAMRLAPLFIKHDRTYQPNRPVWEYLQQYLETLFADTEQSLDQSLLLPFLHPSPQ